MVSVLGTTIGKAVLVHQRTRAHRRHVALRTQPLASSFGVPVTRQAIANASRRNPHAIRCCATRRSRTILHGAQTKKTLMQGQSIS